MNIYIENETDSLLDMNCYEDIVRRAVLCVAEDKSVPEDMDVNVLITDLEGIREINAQSRNIDAPTDVLSFPYFDFDEPGVFDESYETTDDESDDEYDEIILGDIVLCADKVISQAAEYGHSTERELAFLTVHSMLHLLGYDHMEETDGQLMRSEEKRLMNILGISR